MKKNSRIFGLIGVCVLALILTVLPIGGAGSVFLPFIVIFASSLLLCRRPLRVGLVITAAVISLGVLPMGIYMLTQMLMMSSVSGMPWWLLNFLMGVVQNTFVLATFFWVCRILHRKKICGIRGMHVVIAGILLMVAAFLEGASYGFSGDLGQFSVIEMLEFLPSRNWILYGVSQILLYGTLLFVGIILHRTVSRDTVD